MSIIFSQQIIGGKLSLVLNFNSTCMVGGLFLHGLCLEKKETFINYVNTFFNKLLRNITFTIISQQSYVVSYNYL